MTDIPSKSTVMPKVMSTIAEGTWEGEAVRYTYMFYYETDSNPAYYILLAKYGNGKETSIPNGQVIGVVKTSEDSNLYDINLVFNEKSEFPSADGKLEVKHVTNLPTRFVDENRVSSDFPFLRQPSDVGAAEKDPRHSFFYVVVSTHSGKRYVVSQLSPTQRSLYQLNYGVQMFQAIGVSRRYAISSLAF